MRSEAFFHLRARCLPVAVVRNVTLLIALVVAVLGSTAAVGPTALGATPIRWRHSVVSGFSSRSGGGFWLAYADGSIRTSGSARSHGDATRIPLNSPIVGGAVTPNGRGYWLVAKDGGIFTYGTAHFFGSMGRARLNQPLFSMAPTKSGKGYWLVARDGGIFTFGDARFHGSTGKLHLTQPIVGIVTSRTGKGYRLIAGDGGVFSFGDARFRGSLPARGVHVADVVGVAPTPTNRGYWIARRSGRVYAFGDAKRFGSYRAPACDPVAAIFSNPKKAGYRLVTASGRTISFGRAPGGKAPSGAPTRCSTIGHSVQGRPLRVTKVGHGRRQVLWIGGIHGDEPEGSAATAALADAFVKAGLGDRVTLTILEDDNPDGRALHTRANANGVDLNRNFPSTNFDGTVPGTGGTPLSQPESRALFDLFQRVRPQLVISFHAFLGDQFVNFDGPGEAIAAQFSRLSALPVKRSAELGFDTPGSLGSLVGVDRGTPILTVELLRGSDSTTDWRQIRQAVLSVIGA